MEGEGPRGAFSVPWATMPLSKGEARRDEAVWERAGWREENRSADLSRWASRRITNEGRQVMREEEKERKPQPGRNAGSGCLPGQGQSLPRQRTKRPTNETEDTNR